MLFFSHKNINFPNSCKIRSGKKSVVIHKALCRSVFPHFGFISCGCVCFFNRRDGVVVRASASQSVDLGLVTIVGVFNICRVESHQKTLKMVFTASLLGAQQNRDSVENKPASLLVVSLGKTLNGMPPSL